MKALIYEGFVIQIEEETFEVNSSYKWLDCPTGCTIEWTCFNDVFEPPVVLVPTVEQFIHTCLQEIAILLDKTAQEKKYEFALSLISYLNSSVIQWQNEAIVFSEWRDDVYTYFFDLKNQIVEGDISIPSLEDVMNGAPQIEWPN
jgi:hypothetical protein